MNELPYTTVRTTGVKWLGDVPKHWLVRKLGQVGTFLRGRGGSKEDEVPDGVVCIRYGDLYTSHDFFIDTPKGFIAEERTSAYTPVEYGDVLFAASGETIDDIGKSAVNLVRKAHCGGDIIVFRPSVDVEPRFLGYALDCAPMAAQKACMGRGITVMHIYASDLKYLVVALPPKEEQAAIVRFLDQVDERINRLIRAKERLIELLNEQKQAIIHRAVTRGLDPNVPLKPSSLDWLGQIPSHWQEVPIKRLLSRIDYGTSQATTETGQIRVLTMANIQGGDVVFPTAGGLETVPKELLLEPLDLLFTRTNGNPDLVGKVGLYRSTSQQRVSFASYLVRLRTCVPNDPTWLHGVLTTPCFWEFARSHALVNLQTNLNSTRYSRFKLPVPPPAEQRRLAQHIDEARNTFARTTRRIARAVQLLREYHRRLVADSITGKLDTKSVEARHALDSVEEMTESARGRIGASN